MEPFEVVVFPDVWRPGLAFSVSSPLAPPVMDTLGGTECMLRIAAAAWFDITVDEQVELLHDIAVKALRELGRAAGFDGPFADLGDERFQV